MKEFKNEDIQDWIIESHDISQNFIYKNIEYDTKPSDYYMKKAYEIVKRRIALGGYRLAEIIKNVKRSFDKTKREEVDVEINEEKFLPNKKK